MPPILTIDTAGLPDATCFAAYPTQNLAASGGNIPYSFAVTSGALPNGLLLNAAGTLTGTPTQAGTFGFGITALDGSIAEYGGPFAASRNYALSVAKAGSATLLDADTGPTAEGQLVQFSAYVSVAGSVPTGTVDFADGGQPLCTGVPLTNPAAHCSTSAFTTGDHQITATYSGNDVYAGSLSSSVTHSVFASGTFSLTVTIAGSGAGSIESEPSGIDCGPNCSATFESPMQVTLTPMPAAGSRFTGWLGSCTGTGPCGFMMGANKRVTATFAPDSTSLAIDIDGDQSYSALTDGLLILRYLFGMTGPALTSGALGTNAPLTDCRK